MTYEFHPAASWEFQSAAHWYDEEKVGLGDRFSSVIRQDVESILLNPERFQSVGDGLHVLRLKKFPYRIYYHFDASAQKVVIYAVMHNKQQPDYWRARVPSEPQDGGDRYLVGMLAFAPPLRCRGQ